MSIMKGSETKPKRRRLSGCEYLTKRSKKFLSDYDHDHPIIIFISPLRQVQASVLSKNLSASGATVLTSFDRLSSRPNYTKVTVITDNLGKARSMFSDKQTFSPVSFVSTKWASAVLSAQKLLPLDAFVLGGDETLNEGPMAPPKRSTEGRPVLNPTGAKALPVWCTSTVTSKSDISAKQAYLKKLPGLCCERATFTDSVYPSPNVDLSKILEKIGRKRVLECSKDFEHDAEMRARAYFRASAALKCVPFKLSTQEDAAVLNTFGPRVLSVVREYLYTGEVAEVQAMETDARLKMLEEFTNLYGVGLNSARRFYDMLGITNMQDLRQHVKQHPGKFQTSLAKYLSVEDRLIRITQSLARTFCDQVHAILNAGDDSLDVRLMLCGGFRRGKESGHDVDIVYCRSGEQRGNTSSIMAEIVKRLQEAKLVHLVLHESSDRHGWGEIQYSGTSGNGRCSGGKYAYAHDIMHVIGELDGDLFRVDFVGVRDWREMGYATLAWSGSTSFQRDLRLAAESNEWTFNEHGIFDRDTGERVGTSIEAPSEMDIFHILDLPYRACYERSA